MYDLIIVGAGPAGMTACLYALRSRLNALLVDAMQIGGYLHYIDHLENYPGFPGGIAGPELVKRITEQLRGHDFNFEQAEISGVMPAKEKGFLLSAGGKDFSAKTVIIATGAVSKSLGIPGEKELIGRGVSYCAVCDAPFFKNKNIVVIGGGNTALEEAMYLTQFASKVMLVHRSKAFSADAVLQEKVKRNEKIELVLNAACKKIFGQGKVEGVRIEESSGTARDIPSQGVFIFDGIRPSTDFVRNLLEKDEFGYIITNDSGATNTPGIFACGDCCRVPLRQVVTACGKGADAAYAARKFLEKTTPA